ncbi:hypothetical protein D0863_14114 [Hortaea werneckii]|uniref:tRNA-splicing endonuclease subunit Sen2 n=1 Tax=Hortaea werneckii TaxID=91943 RepID=A0A3M7CLE7_HORWE|nr:hypothetical protein D0863_14114 [Hortaea werneckii]
MAAAVADAPSPPGPTENPANGPSTSAVEQKKPRPRKRGPNYAQIHAKPLPLEVHPLPAFQPSHPLSLLHLCYVYLQQLISPPSSHPATPYAGYFSPETRSVHVTDPATVRALWEMGFFGKGTLSRSEPSWLEREKARLLAEKAKRKGGVKGGTAEEATMARREERRLFKLERARAERERIERQRAVEEGRMSREEFDRLEAEAEAIDTGTTRAVAEAAVAAAKKAGSTEQATQPQPRVPDAEIIEPSAAQPDDSTGTPGVTVTAPCGTAVSPEVPEIHEPEPEPLIENQEHLQLTLEEAFFLSFGLGVLSIRTAADPSRPLSNNTSDLLTLFSQSSYFPPRTAPVLPSPVIDPDSPFLLNYVTYHHFRSLGWVVRPGVKFAVDYLLYNRGPVFSHAEFAVVILPAYTHAYWQTAEGHERKRFTEMQDWWWLHCVNRVQSQVRKSLVLCYVDVPPPPQVSAEENGAREGGVRGLLKGYKVREFVLRRWLANRSRD